MERIKTYLILFAGVFALSTSAIFVKIAEAPSGIIALYRLLIAAVVLLPFLLLKRESRKEFFGLKGRQIFLMAAAGFFLALHYVMWFESLNYTSIASSTVLVSLQPLFSLALEWFILKKRTKPIALFGCLIALVGSFIIGFGDFQISGISLWGDILAFLAAGVIAVYFFIGEKVRQELSALTYSASGYFFSALILLIYALLKKDSLFAYSGKTWLSFAGIAVIATIGGQFIFNLLLKKLPASAVTMSILGEPIGTCILAFLLLGEGISLRQLAGIAVIMVGMALFFLQREKNKKT